MLHPYMKRSRSSPGAENVSATRSSHTISEPPLGERLARLARSTGTGFDMSWTASTISARSASSPIVAASACRNSTASASPVSLAWRGRPRRMVRRGRCRRPVRADRRERSRASTSPRRSRCRPRVPGGSALRRSWTSRMAGSHSLPRRCVMAGRLKLAWPSRMSAPYASHPWPAPDRYTSATAGNWPIAATTIRDSGAIRLRLSGSTSTSRKPSGRLNRCSASTSRIPPTACCSSHSRA